MARSAWGVTVVVADAVRVLGSDVAVRLTPFVMLPPANEGDVEACSVIVDVVTASCAIVQVTVPLLLPQLQPLPLALTKVSVGGSTSVSARSDANDGPGVVTGIVYVITVPENAEEGAFLATERFVCQTRGTESVAVLSLLSGSFEGVEMVASSVTTGP